MKTGIKILILIIVVIAVIVVLFLGSRIWLNYTWFDKLGYTQVFTKIIWTKILLWFSFFFLFLAFAGVNLILAFNKGKIQSIKIQQAGVPIEISRKVGAIIAFKWEIILKFLNKSTFNQQDPIFSRDISFYIFTLPVYIFLKSWSLGSVILTIIAVGFIYLVSGNITFEYNKLTVNDVVKRHLLFLIMLVAIIIGWNYRLKVYQIMFSSRGLIFGAGYTDVHVVRPAYYIMIAVSLFTAVLCYLGFKEAKFKKPLIGYGILIGGAIVITGIIPGVVQQISVRPNELVRELPYLKHNINFTRKAYNLENIESKPFPVAYNLTAEDFSPERGILKNIRLWDHRPLKSTFSQLQEFRLYYDFNDVDVDRYHFGNTYRQVMLSARELSYYEEVGEEGLPVLLVKDIPPKVSVPLKIERPEIYYGEKTDLYVIVNTKLEEFDYPSGDTNVTTRYQGTGGIPIKNGFRKFLLSLRLKSLEIIFTGYITPESRLMIYRSIQERVPKLAPFFRYDPDPYLVVYNGRLIWIMDAYTTTDRYPYSQHYIDRFNYIRNPVKVTVDAYTGDVNFYVIDIPII